jgi:Response regulator containing a CheY-like receiver domain and an HTH DNA-binding domain
MDLQMPIMDGIAATKAIREGRAGDNKDIPIVALTANDELQKESLEAGCNFFLTKPASIDTLNKVIQECLQRRG